MKEKTDKLLGDIAKLQTLSFPVASDLYHMLEFFRTSYTDSQTREDIIRERAFQGVIENNFYTFNQEQQKNIVSKLLDRHWEDRIIVTESTYYHEGLGAIAISHPAFWPQCIQFINNDKFEHEFIQNVERASGEVEARKAMASACLRNEKFHAQFISKMLHEWEKSGLITPEKNIELQSYILEKGLEDTWELCDVPGLKEEKLDSLKNQLKDIVEKELSWARGDLRKLSMGDCFEVYVRSKQTESFEASQDAISRKKSDGTDGIYIHPINIKSSTFRLDAVMPNINETMKKLFEASDLLKSDKTLSKDDFNRIKTTIKYVNDHRTEWKKECQEAITQFPTQNRESFGANWSHYIDALLQMKRNIESFKITGTPAQETIEKYDYYISQVEEMLSRVKESHKQHKETVEANKWDIAEFAAEEKRQKQEYYFELLKLQKKMEELRKTIYSK